MASLDPSIYNQTGRVNMGAGLSDILNEQRTREAQAEQRQNTLAAMAMQQEDRQISLADRAAQQQAAKQRSQQEAGKSLNMWLANAMQAGRPIEEVLPEAIAKGAEYRIDPERTTKHVQSVYASGATAQERSMSAARQAMPEEFTKGLLTPPKAERTYTKEVLGQDGKPTIVSEAESLGMTPYRSTAPVSDIAQQRLDLERQKFDFQKTGGAATARKPMTSDQEAKYRQKFGEAYGTTLNALQSAENVTALANELKDHKGLAGITGLSGYVPDYPSGDAAAARQKFETLQGKITKMAKDAAASSGSIGPMAVQEWKILRDQIESIDPSKLGEKQMQDVLDDLVIQASNAAKITEEAYTSTFSPDFETYPQFSNPRGAIANANARPKQSPSQPALKAGAVEDGHVYIGGDPANPASWRKQ